MTSPLRVAISSSASDGAINMSPSNASTGSKSSDRQVQTIVKLWRVTVTVRLMPRLSSSSAITAAGRDAVPRSIRRDSSQVVPSASSGSEAEPARMARLIATAGVVDVDLARTTAPFSRTVRAGFKPRGCVTLHTSDF